MLFMYTLTIMINQNIPLFSLNCLQTTSLVNHLSLSIDDVRSHETARNGQNFSVLIFLLSLVSYEKNINKDKICNDQVTLFSTIVSCSENSENNDSIGYLNFFVFWHFCTNVVNFPRSAKLHRHCQTYVLLNYELTSIFPNEIYD